MKKLENSRRSSIDDIIENVIEKNSRQIAFGLVISIFLDFLEEDANEKASLENDWREITEDFLSLFEDEAPPEEMEAFFYRTESIILKMKESTNYFENNTILTIKHLSAIGDLFLRILKNRDPSEDFYLEIDNFDKFGFSDKWVREILFELVLASKDLIEKLMLETRISKGLH